MFKAVAGEDLHSFVVNQLDQLGQKLRDTEREIDTIKGVSGAIGSAVSGASTATQASTAPFLQFIKDALINPGAIQGRAGEGGIGSDAARQGAGAATPFQPEGNAIDLLKAASDADAERTAAAVNESGNSIASMLANGFNAVVQAISSLQNKDLRVGIPSAVGVRGATGGRLSGPGGPKEDKIPIWASDGEYIINAKQTSKHLSLLNDINEGRYADGGLARFAEGGQAGGSIDALGEQAKMEVARQKGSGSFQWPVLTNDYTDDEKAGYLLQAITTALGGTPSAQSGGAIGEIVKIATGQASGQGHALGGLIGLGDSLGSLVSSFSDSKHFADGGPAGGAGMAGAIEAPGIASLGLHTVDLRTDFGNVGVMADRSGLRQLNAAATTRAMKSTGPKPAWYR